MPIRVAMAQLATRVGDINGNLASIRAVWHEAADLGADLVVFTELAITGYPPEDLLLKPEFLTAADAAVTELAATGPDGTVAVFGTVGHVGVGEGVVNGGSDVSASGDITVSAGRLRNRAVVVADGRVVGRYDKWRLPNFGVFDEARYFVADDNPLVVTIAGVPVGVTICEDMWSRRGPVARAVAHGARLVVNLNASPWYTGKRQSREQWVRHHSTSHGVHFAWVNTVGGQDDVVFDGDSMLAGPDGTILARGAEFAVDLVVVDVESETARATKSTKTTDAVAASGASVPGHRGQRGAMPTRVDADRLPPLEATWRALVLATGDYCRRNGFTDAIVALSGGLDSAVTGAIAVDALGSDHVMGVLLPSPYSSGHSVDDALALADNLDIRTHTIEIQPGMTAMDQMLASTMQAEATGVVAGDQVVSLTEENIQARLRGQIVMALSNATGALVLTTGNKSEYAVGYATLYGDMAGGFAPLKDVPKTLVFDLARHRNTHGVAIPVNTISKPPSAELRPGQVDQDSLPSYVVLDDIIEGYIEHNLGVEALVTRGHEEELVRSVLRLIDRAEYKRRQAAPGPKVTSRAFGKDRRVPITHGWRG